MNKAGQKFPKIQNLNKVPPLSVCNLHFSVKPIYLYYPEGKTNKLYVVKRNLFYKFSTQCFNKTFLLFVIMFKRV